MSDKSNITHLRNILKELKDDTIGEVARNKKWEEADEFIEAIDDKLISQRDKIKELEKDVEEWKDEAADNEDKFDEQVDLGLDTFFWSLEKENLVIKEEVESFVNRLKKKYIQS